MTIDRFFIEWHEKTLNNRKMSRGHFFTGRGGGATPLWLEPCGSVLFLAGPPEIPLLQSWSTYTNTGRISYAIVPRLRAVYYLAQRTSLPLIFQA